MVGQWSWLMWVLEGCSTRKGALFPLGQTAKQPDTRAEAVIIPVWGITGMKHILHPDNFPYVILKKI